MSKDYQFRNTQIFKNMSLYSSTSVRVNFELLLIFNIIKYFKFNEILEIGFYQGKTFGALLEAVDKGSLTAIDITFDLSLYDKIYKDSEHTKNKEITFLNMSSLEFESDKKYDFINVDGDHSMPVVLQDLIKSVNLVDPLGILMIDDYQIPDINFAIDQLLALHPNFVPFLMDEQAVFFHYISHNAAEFLDTELVKIFGTFCDVHDVEYKGHQVKKISCLPAVTGNDDVFSLICNRYNL